MSVIQYLQYTKCHVLRFKIFWEERKEEDINPRLLDVFYNKLQKLAARKEPEDTFVSMFKKKKIRDERININMI